MRPAIVSGALLLATALLGPVLAVAPSSLATNPAYLLERQIRSRELLARLISQLPVERRKAVTIGFNRFFKPLTFQVPDMISNLLPSSSNLIKVHDDPKNGSKTPSASQGDQSTTTNPLLTYDPMQLLTNFDPNLFGKTNNPQMPSSAYPFGNGTFDFDEAGLANAVPNMLFGGHMGNAPMPIGDKFPSSIPLYHHESLGQLSKVRRPPPYYSSGGHQIGHHQAQQAHQAHHAHHQDPAKHPANFASSPGDDISEHLARLKQKYGLQMDEPSVGHRGPQRPMDNGHESFQQPHRPPPRSPYYQQNQKSQYSNEPMPNQYESYNSDRQPPTQHYGDNVRNVENDEPVSSYHYGGRQPITFNDDYQQEFGNGRGQAERPRPEMDNDEPRYFQQNNEQKQPKMNQEQSNSNIGSYSDFYNQIPSSKEPLDMAENKPLNGDENKGSQQEIMASEQSRPEAGYTSYFNPIRAAASALNPVVLGLDGRAPELTENKRPPLPADLSNIAPLMPLGLNIYPDPQLKLGHPRPVANRIKEFFKSMINQRY